MVDLSDERVARDLALRLEDWSSRHVPWILCHTPNDTEVLLWGGDTSGLCVATDWTALPWRRGYLVAPFDVSAQTPLVYVDLPTDPIRYHYRTGRLEQSPQLGPMSSIPDECYSQDFGCFARALEQGRYDKLVLARTLDVARGGSFAPLDSFLRAVNRYPSAYAYLLYTPQTGMWLGATPEVLVSAEGVHCRTMALAGTLSADEGESWTSQHRAEQGCVADYIVESLEQLDLSPSQSATYTAYAGALAHLRTDIEFSLHRRGQLYEVLERLHPTPAVCGLPKEASLRFIQENESIDRQYYSGCLGLVDPEGQSAVYVNLRCMQAFPDILRLYAGGGLLSGSRLESEWQETERKLQTMRSIL